MVIHIESWQCWIILARASPPTTPNGRRREPGNIRVKSCRLPAPESGGTNQIAE